MTDSQFETPPIVTGYRIPSGCKDELLDDHGSPLPHAHALVAALERLGPDALRDIGERRDRIFMQQGITFEVAGSDGERRDRAWPMDLVPRVIRAAEWTTIKRGLAQRIRALNAFVDDVYHAHEIVRAGIIPWSLIVSRPSFARPVHGVRAPGGVYCHVCGCDLVRDGEGRWRVLEDNVRTPSGISYVLENRVAMTRLMPELFAGHRVRGVANYPSLLLDALRAVAPAAESTPTVVLWTPGAMNSAYFEHAFLARQMGVELVEPGDLVVRDAVCYIRTTSGLQRVHTIYRRLDDDFIDPLEFRPDSLLGVPGLVRAYRAGTVAIANAIGTGVADDKAVYCYVPQMIRFYLSEEPILENVPTYLLDDEATRRHVISRLHELVVKPTSESGGKGVFIGPQASAAERELQGRMIEDRPSRYIAQELVHLSTAPTATPDGGLAPRHVDLRPFAVFGDEIRIVPGGLTRVALREGSMIVNSSQGGGSKDTWVLEEEGASSDLAQGSLPVHRPPRLPDVRYGGWQTQAQQQQQTRPHRDRPLGNLACESAPAD
ncbi:MAG: circularly permuted type 2 ATP-grasp protein [Solirubrobacteraceae bacterium]